MLYFLRRNYEFGKKKFLSYFISCFVQLLRITFLKFLLSTKFYLFKFSLLFYTT